MSTRVQHRGRHYPRGVDAPSPVFAWRSVGGIMATAGPHRWLLYKTPYSTAFIWQRPFGATPSPPSTGNDDYIIRARRRGRR